MHKPGIAQTGQISGKILDKNTNQPVPGDNVIIQGATIGAATDFDGNYVIISYKQEIIEGITVQQGRDNTCKYFY